MIFVSGISLAIPVKLARESRLGETRLETHRQGSSQTVSLMGALHKAVSRGSRRRNLREINEKYTGDKNNMKLQQCDGSAQWST